MQSSSILRLQFKIHWSKGFDRCSMDLGKFTAMAFSRCMIGRLDEQHGFSLMVV
jgi:hypothetical protein